jgi:phage terminase large subunit-like protein
MRVQSGESCHGSTCQRKTPESANRPAAQNTRTWGRRGLITLTPGNTIDYETIRKQIISDCQRFDVDQIGADPWNLEYIRQLLAEELDSNELIIPVGQNFKELSGPTKELEKLVLEQAIAHGGHEMLAWMAGNCVPA